jgi:hypothetical protein
VEHFELQLVELRGAIFHDLSLRAICRFLAPRHFYSTEYSCHFTGPVTLYGVETRPWGGVQNGAQRSETFRFLELLSATRNAFSAMHSNQGELESLSRFLATLASLQQAHTVAALSKGEAMYR